MLYFVKMLTVAVAESDDNALNNTFSVFYICVLSQKKKRKLNRTLLFSQTLASQCQNKLTKVP